MERYVIIDNRVFKISSSKDGEISTFTPVPCDWVLNTNQRGLLPFAGFAAVVVVVCLFVLV